MTIKRRFEILRKLVTGAVNDDGEHSVIIAHLEILEADCESNSVATDVSKRISCYVAKNKDEFDVENMSLYKTKSKAIKEWGNEQEIVNATIIF